MSLNSVPEYRLWKAMRWRCNPKNKVRARYYDRGIRVCERWDIYQNFINDMGSRPTTKHTLDRIDNNKGYSPENCRWATYTEQANNTSRTNYANTRNGGKVNLMHIARNTGIHPETLRARIKRGWYAEELDIPPIKANSRARSNNGRFV